MNNPLKILLIFIFITNCSLHKGSKFWKKEKILEEKIINIEKILKKEELFKTEEALNLEFNAGLKISLKSKIIDQSFLNKFDNNNGRVDFNGNLKSISKYKFSKIKDFYQYDPEILFYNNDIIFFDNKGSILRFNNNSDLIWRKNNYTKSEKKQNPILFFANNKKTLIVADNIAKYYALDVETGEVLWSKKNIAPFNSQIKIYKNNFFVIDFENVLRAYSIIDGHEIWNIKTENSLIRSQKKLSMVIIKNKIFFNSSLGDISAVDIETGDLIWQIPTQSIANDDSFSLKTSEIIANKNALYFSNNKNQFFSLDTQSGILNWKQKINSNLRPTLIDDYIFTVSLEGYLAVIEKNSGNIIRITDIFKNLNIKRRNKIKPSGFIVGNNNIYITTTHGRLLVVSTSTGRVTNVIKIDKGKISRPAVLNQKLFIITESSIIKLN